MSGTKNPGARIFLADDHPAVREGLTLLLAQGRHVVCGQAASIGQALDILDDCAPALALVDLSLAEESGLDLIPALAARDIPALVYSMHEDAATVNRALECGAKGFVTKRETSAVLLQAVETLLAGETYISPRATESLNSAARKAGRPAQALSERELQIMDLLSQGESNAEIAETLHLSIRTVETYFSRIIIKLGLEGMKDLRKYAIRRRQAP